MIVMMMMMMMMTIMVMIMMTMMMTKMAIDDDDDDDDNDDDGDDSDDNFSRELFSAVLIRYLLSSWTCLGTASGSVWNGSRVNTAFDLKDGKL